MSWKSPKEAVLRKHPTAVAVLIRTSPYQRWAIQVEGRTLSVGGTAVSAWRRSVGQR